MEISCDRLFVICENCVIIFVFLRKMALIDGTRSPQNNEDQRVTLASGNLSAYGLRRESRPKEDRVRIDFSCIATY